jgi:hypothetical protein
METRSSRSTAHALTALLALLALAGPSFAADPCPSLTGDWLAENSAPGSVDAVWEIVEDGAGNLTVDTGSDTLTGSRAVPGELSSVTLASTNEPITFSGEMTTCDEVLLDIDQLPYVITLTRQAAPPMCPGASPIDGAKLTFSRMGAPSGDEGLAVRGTVLVPQELVSTPSLVGVQLLVEDLGAGSARIVDVTHLTEPVPTGAEDACAARGEGWRRLTFRNVVKPGDAPECVLGTADRLIATFRMPRVPGAGLAFNFRLSGATIPAPVGPVRLTVVLGNDADAFAAATCGNPQPTLTCTASYNGKTVRCS